MPDKKSCDWGDFAEREKIFWFWLCGIDTLGPAGMFRIAEGLTSPEDASMLDPAELSLRTGISKKTADAVRAARKDLLKAQEDYLKLAETGVRMCLYDSDEYPERLREIKSPPFALFIKGDLPCEDTASAAIVGSRACTPYGYAEAARFSEELAGAGVQIISGLAAGIDRQAHEGALNAGGKTWAVMGCGIDECYPRENYSVYERILETGGGIISEYPPHTPPIAGHFPVRNRIISGLSDAVLVIEARRKSGTQITVSFAAEQGKDVFALPGRLGDPLSEGCLEMIRDGAQVLTGTTQILECLAGKNHLSFDRTCSEGSDKYMKINIADEDKEVYSALSNDPQRPDEITQKTGKDLTEVYLSLLRLELKGHIIQPWPGSYMLSARRKS